MRSLVLLMLYALLLLTQPAAIWPRRESGGGGSYCTTSTADFCEDWEEGQTTCTSVTQVDVSSNTFGTPNDCAYATSPAPIEGSYSALNQPRETIEFTDDFGVAVCDSAETNCEIRIHFAATAYTKAAIVEQFDFYDSGQTNLIARWSWRPGNGVSRLTVAGVNSTNDTIGGTYPTSTYYKLCIQLDLANNGGVAWVHADTGTFCNDGTELAKYTVADQGGTARKMDELVINGSNASDNNLKIIGPIEVCDGGC